MKIAADSILASLLEKKTVQAMSSWSIWHTIERKASGLPHHDRYQLIKKISNLCKKAYY